MTSSASQHSQMLVPLLDLRRGADELDSELRDAFQRVLVSGQYILGPEVEALEAECARYLGCEFAIGVSSGTDALLVALMALGVGPGDEVICPTYTFFASAGTIWRTGARPVFVDSSLEDFNVLPAQIAEKISARTKAIVPVHLFGQMADMDAICHAAGSIPVVEDAAQAFGATGRAGGAGNAGALGCFSFFPSKNLGGFGDSGLVSSRDAQLADTVRLLRAHGGRPKYHHHVVGGNFRIDALQAALLRPKLRRLAGWTERRRINASLYTDLLQGTGIAAPNTGQERGEAAVLYPRATEGHHIYNQYCVRIIGAGRRDQLKTYLQERGVGTEIYYPIPMHLQACFASLGHQRGDFPFAERAADEALALPIFPYLRPEEIHYVVDHIATFFAESS
jgi:dTDP-4-amino-4,6-dideoxygalactose transaminase